MNAGLVSSVAMSHIQGISLVNPDVIQKQLSEAKSNYFSSKSGFQTVINERQNNQ
jgi:hypothetical protein